ncbi:S-layer homology domain-containing protein [Ureibacillus chungkukjangi]|uniref:S-layer homology domain-containing protein n=1 Tax=Ureibacillus chungkukjangi TaxID=1202712 RepID=UPI00384C4266
MANQPKKYKKFVATAATATLVASAIVPVASAATPSFPDIAGTGYDEAINAIADLGIVKGYEDGTFKPLNTVNRAGVVKFLGKYLVAQGKKLPTYEEATANGFPFTDLNAASDKELVQYAALVKKEEVFNGYQDGSLKPTLEIPRYQMAAVLVNAIEAIYGVDVAEEAKKANFASKITDIKGVSNEAAIVGLEFAGLTVVEKFDPTRTLNRGQFANFLSRTIDYAATLAPTVSSVTAINDTTAYVNFETNIGDVSEANFTVDNNVSVIKAEVNPNNKKQVKITFNKPLVDLTTYKVTVDGVKSEAGAAMKEASTVEFKYEIAEVATISLSKTKFYNGDNILDAVVVKDANGLTLNNEDLSIELSSTSATVDTTTGVVSADAAESFYVEVKVKNGSTVLATTGAVKVDVLPSLEIAGLEGIHIGDLTPASEVTDYTSAKKAGELDTKLKVNESGETLNLFAKDVEGNIVYITPTEGTTITNLNPTVANVAIVDGEFVINTVSTGKASAKIKVDNIEYTVSFDVLANEKVADATLSSTTAKLDSSSNDLSSEKEITVAFKDQYGEAYTSLANVNVDNDTATVLTYDDNSKLTVKSSNVRVATASVDADGKITVARPETNHVKGSATVTVEYKNASGTVVFNKTISVTSTDFDSAVASYDLEIISANTALDADNDANETGADNDDSVEVVLNKLDKNGNIIGQEEFEGDGVALTATTSNTTDQVFLEDVSYADGVATVALTEDALLKLVKSGTVKLTATKGGVAVDTLNVNYTNTDSVATKAVVNTTSKTYDLSVLGGTTITLDELIFGKLNTAGTNYIVNPVVSVQDQFAKVMGYDLEVPGLNTLTNGVEVDASTAVVTNLNNVTNVDGTLSLTDDTKAGTLTIVIPTIVTEENGDLLSAPVSINVTLVK